ncbi:MAG: serine hydrolase [Kiritimatiellae bacterium]|nr:serine hydrolase [Kiritimatiellia bacterium]
MTVKIIAAAACAACAAALTAAEESKPADGPVGGAAIYGNANGRRKVEKFGYADKMRKVPFTEDTVCWIASNTKGFAAATVLTLVDDGLVSLDDPVAKHLPEFAQLKVKGKDGAVRPAKTAMTIRHVLSHTSGLEFAPGFPIDSRPVRLLAQMGAKSYLWTDPGTGYRYSNWGIDVAAAVVEAVTGMPWEERLQKRILNPLEMKDTTFWPDEDQLARLAKGYALKDGAEPVEAENVQLQWPLDRHSRFAEAGGGLFSTANDMYKFFRMLANRGYGVHSRVISEKSMREWYRKQTPDALKENYSFGMGVDPEKGLIEHGGAWNTKGIADWKNGTVCIYMVQNATSNKSSKELLAERIESAKKFCAANPVEWTDGLSLPIEGRAFPVAELTTPYSRLPVAWSNKYSRSNWGLQFHPSGMAFRFRTDSPRLRVKYLLGHTPRSSPHMPATGSCGVDVYQKVAGAWRYLAPRFPDNQTLENNNSWEIPVTPEAETLVYLPSYNSLQSIEFGVAPGSKITPVAKPSAKPVVFYGTSITQGGCSSRPGMSWPSVAGREGNFEVVNYGFSGSGCMEIELAYVLARIDAAVYVLDNISNMNPKYVEERFEKFLRYLNSKRPETPVMVTDNLWRHSDNHDKTWKAMSDIVVRLKKEDPAKWAKLSLGCGGKEYDLDWDYTVDGLHLADWGMKQVGVAFAREVLKVIGR